MSDKTGTEIVTFGCRLNTYESEVMKGHAEKAGLDGAIVFNTCAVTNEAVRQARQAIRKARRERPDARIIVTGCAAQIAPQDFSDMPEVDLVIGNEEKMKAASWRPALALHANERVRVNDIMSVTETAGHLVQGFEGRARAFVQVQNGCDHRCTFCIIPYGRGNSRSVPAGEIVTQIRTLVENGYREVVLTGVDITSYGADLPGSPSLGHLATRILKLVPELAALADFLHRLNRSRRRADAPDRRRGTADAASASVAAVGRQHDPEAHEAASSHARIRSASARRRGVCAPTSSSARISSPAFRPKPRRCLKTPCGLRTNAA